MLALVREKLTELATFIEPEHWYEHDQQLGALLAAYDAQAAALAAAEARATEAEEELATSRASWELEQRVWVAGAQGLKRDVAAAEAEVARLRGGDELTLAKLQPMFYGPPRTAAELQAYRHNANGAGTNEAFRVGQEDGGRSVAQLVQSLLTQAAAPQQEGREDKLTNCCADRDGDCSAKGCPQLRDNEPYATGRSCPLPDYERD